jgi:hypothetical protein
MALLLAVEASRSQKDLASNSKLVKGKGSSSHGKGEGRE